MEKLENLGERICIIGPSNSGKSMLSSKLSYKLGYPAIHLDGIAHIPNTNWKRRMDQNFVNDHDKIISSGKWIMDGNYSVCMRQRFAHATSVIWLDMPLLGCMLRYIMRSLKGDRFRAGRLDGAQGEFSLSLIKYTLCNYPKNRKKYECFIKESRKPLLRICSMEALKDYALRWGLE